MERLRVCLKGHICWTKLQSSSVSVEMIPEKNLHTPGEGIFETHVTWEDIEHDAQKAFGTSATFGINKNVQNIGDGNGFASRVCLIHPDWQNMKDGEHLPTKFIGKFCTLIPLLALTKKISEEKGVDNFLNMSSITNMDELIMKFHNTEVHVYELLNKYNVTAVPRAKLYWARKFSKENPLKGLMLMEYMDNLTQVHLFSVLKPEECHQALRALAAYGAMTFKLTKEERSFFSNKPLTELFGIMFTDESIKSIDVFLTKYEGQHKGIADELRGVLNELIDTVWLDSIPDRLNMAKTLCHGDLWSANMLWREQNGIKSVAAIVDYQTAHLGNPAADLSRFISSNLDGDERIKYQDELLETFYKFLLEELGPQPAPYTLETLKEAYRCYQPVSGFMMCPLFGSAWDLFVDKIPEDQRENAKKILDSKLGCLVEEVLAEHKRNKTLRFGK